MFDMRMGQSVGKVLMHFSNFEFASHLILRKPKSGRQTVYGKFETNKTTKTTTKYSIDPKNRIWPFAKRAIVPEEKEMSMDSSKKYETSKNSRGLKLAGRRINYILFIIAYEREEGGHAKLYKILHLFFRPDLGAGRGFRTALDTSELVKWQLLRKESF